MKMTSNPNANIGSSLKVAALALLCSFVLILGGIAIAPSRTSAQGSFNSQTTVALPNQSFPAMTFTATAQTRFQPLGGAASATVEVYGVATAATFQIFGSNDGGVNYFGLPFTTGAYTTNVLQVTTAGTFPAYSGTPALYFVNVAGLTNLKVVSSGTFTGASANVKIVASSNKGLL
jgi:hypothetical protein